MGRAINPKLIQKDLPRAVTYAVEIPSKSEFIDMVDNEERTISLGIGSAQCSRKDQFLKSKGRELSQSRMALNTFQVQTITFFKDYSIFVLKNITEEGVCFQIRLKIHKNSEKIHLLNIH